MIHKRSDFIFRCSLSWICRNKNGNISKYPEVMSALALGVYKIVTVAAGCCFDNALYNSEQKKSLLQKFYNLSNNTVNTCMFPNHMKL